MCMNLQNSHPFTESAEGIAVHGHHAVLQAPPESLWGAALRASWPKGVASASCEDLGGFVSQSDKKYI